MGLHLGLRFLIVGRDSLDIILIFNQPEKTNILQQKIDLEVQKARAAGLCSTSTLPFRNLQISPLGLVPKQKPGEFRVIHHFLFRRNYQLTMVFQKNFLL